MARGVMTGRPLEGLFVERETDGGHSTAQVCNEGSDPEPPRVIGSVSFLMVTHLRTIMVRLATSHFSTSVSVLSLYCSL